MSRTNKHRKMREIKEQIKHLTKEGEDYSTSDFIDLKNQFNSLRHGNKRKSVAKDKVLERRAERKRFKNDKIINEE